MFEPRSARWPDRPFSPPSHSLSLSSLPPPLIPPCPLTRLKFTLSVISIGAPFRTHTHTLARAHARNWIFEIPALPRTWRLDFVYRKCVTRPLPSIARPFLSAEQVPSTMYFAVSQRTATAKIFIVPRTRGNTSRRIRTSSGIAAKKRSTSPKKKSAQRRERRENERPSSRINGET